MFGMLMLPKWGLSGEHYVSLARTPPLVGWCLDGPGMLIVYPLFHLIQISVVLRKKVFALPSQSVAGSEFECVV